MATSSRQVRLKRYPEGMPKRDNFEIVETQVPEPERGQVLVRNLYMSVDPYMRGRMREGGFGLGEALSGGAVGRVVRSEAPAYRQGDHVLSSLGWRESFVAEAEQLTPIDPELAPVESYLGVMGMPGMTAWIGMLHIGEVRGDETVLVSGAAGAVGSVACQIGKLLGCRVVGTAGSQKKIDWLLDVAGIDAAVNYKETDDLAGALRKQSPEGYNVYYDNVSGETLEAAIEVLNPHGRVIACGSISRYNATEPPCAPRNLGSIVGKRLTIRGFLQGDYGHLRPRFRTEMARWIAEGRVRYEETVREGLENAPEAFIGLFEGENLGKMLVRIAEE